MWKKDDEQTGQRTAQSPLPATGPSRPAASSGQAVIGPSISIKGDVTGSEDLLIQGEVDGSVTLEDHAVGVGTEGRVRADIVGRVITVEGSVEGDLQAQEQIVLRGTAKVKGDIKAPRVVLEDGATFRGLVDMGAPPASSKEKAKGESSSAAGTSGNGAVKGTDDDDEETASAGDADSSSSSRSSSKGSKTAGGRASATA
ncbi:MAG: polymer-forming cytoskeletal protein [Longimicrobiales bacterium]|nr:polymer-forming cytoskeletal protein [Longimicrobiales bacterium]